MKQMYCSLKNCSVTIWRDGNLHAANIDLNEMTQCELPVIRAFKDDKRVH